MFKNFNHTSEKCYHYYRNHVISGVRDKSQREIHRFCFQFLSYLV